MRFVRVPTAVSEYLLDVDFTFSMLRTYQAPHIHTCVLYCRPFILHRDEAERAFSDLDALTLSNMVAQMEIHQSKIETKSGRAVTDVVPQQPRRNSSVLSVSAVRDTGQKFGM